MGGGRRTIVEGYFYEFEFFVYDCDFSVCDDGNDVSGVDGGGCYACDEGVREWVAYTTTHCRGIHVCITVHPLVGRRQKTRGFKIKKCINRRSNRRSRR
jgi:hypothetical protein